ncbi:hypothetical protein [Nonomuraea wenchangensis]|uniref:hypothetical protein n=1 Tax=Nonomuraea wenchangensis TaxID=568860 RepID=UPI000B85DE3E|nr:hypothetical protein [Nonomuraea wenchangensis]
MLHNDAVTARARVLSQVAACKRYGEVAEPAFTAWRGEPHSLQVLRDGIRIDAVRVATMGLEIDRELAADR